MKTVKDGKTLTSRRGKPERGGRMGDNMTDKQMQIILTLVADKFAGCKDMAEVEKAIQEVREMAKKEKPTE